MTEALTASGPTTVAVLQFRVGGALMAVPSGLVEEVMRAPRTTRVPHAPDCVLGVSNHRGRVMPVVSAASLLGIVGQAASSSNRTIVLDLIPSLGLAVDEVLGLTAIEAPIAGAGFVFVEDDTAIRAVDLLAALDRAFGDGAIQRGVRAVIGAPVAAAPYASVLDTARLILTFAVSSQVYALALTDVEEVADLTEAVAAMPHGQQADLGVIPYRNGVLPVVDLAVLLGLTASRARGKLVVVRLGGALVGLRVDRLEIIQRVADADITAAPALLNRGGGEAAIASLVRLDRTRVVSILTPERLFRADALEKIMSDGRRELEIATEAQDAGTESVLLFQLGEETYGLPLSDVQEVIAVPDVLTRVPNAPSFIEGVINLRGRVLPVIDQTRRFGAATAPTAARKVIVTRSGTLQAGFIVDGVSAIRKIPRSDLSEPSGLLSGGRRLFDQVARSADGDVVLIVDARALLDQAEADVLVTLASEAGPAS